MNKLKKQKSGGTDMVEDKWDLFLPIRFVLGLIALGILFIVVKIKGLLGARIRPNRKGRHTGNRTLHH